MSEYYLHALTRILGKHVYCLAWAGTAMNDKLCKLLQNIKINRQIRELEKCFYCLRLKRGHCADVKVYSIINKVEQE